MSLIHIADPQGRQQSYEPQEALRLWNEGGITHDSLYWREGMSGWKPAAEYFNSLPQPTAPDVMPPSLLSSQVPRGFVKDPTGLTKLLVFMLWAYVGACAVSALTTIISLATGRAQNADPEEMSALDWVEFMTSLPQMLIVLVTGIAFLMWIYRANRNARGFGAQGMTFTPGWSVGWFFIPFANLWKPYQAMKEIWKASINPSSWQSQSPPNFLSTWWTLWIVSNVLSNASFRVSIRAESVQQVIAGEVITLVSNLFDIPLCLIALRLVRELMRHQNHWAAQAAQSSQNSCGVCHQPTSPSEMILLNNIWVCANCKSTLLQQIRENAPGPQA